MDIGNVHDETAARAYGIFKGQVVVLIHSGSRGLGHQVCTDYVSVMNQSMAKHHISLPDRQLARLLRRPIRGVLGRRSKLRILIRPLHRWTPQDDKLLGTKPDRVLAMRFGRSVLAVRVRRGQKHIRLRKDWRPEDDKMLGTRIDREVAKLLGRTKSNVTQRRNKLGIPPKGKARAKKDQQPGAETPATTE